MKLHLLPHRSPSVVWPCSQQATDWYQSIAQGLETPAVCYSTYLLPLGIVTDQFLRRQSSPCLLSKMSPRYILKQLYSIEGNVLFISSLGSPRTSSVTVLHVWQQTKIFFFFSLLFISVLLLNFLNLILTVLSLCCCIGFPLVALSSSYFLVAVHRLSLLRLLLSWSTCLVRMSSVVAASRL